VKARLVAANLPRERAMNVARTLAATLATACLVLPATPSLAYCPTRDTARQGYALVGSQGGARLQVKPSSDDMVTYDLIIGGKVASTPSYYRGAYLVRFVTGTAATDVTYDFDYTREPDFYLGQQKSYRMTLKTPDGVSTTSMVSFRVAGQEVLVMGDCALDTFAIESQTVYPDRPMQKREVNFSPALRMYVRATITSEGTPPNVQIYDRIEPPGQ
jgi:hypothetical protein